MTKIHNPMNKSKGNNFFRILFCAFLFFCMFGAKIYAQEKILIKSHSASFDDKKKSTVLKNVRLTYKDIVITANFCEYNIKSQNGQLSGNVMLNQSGTTITGNRMNVSYKEKKAILLGNVCLTKRQIGKGPLIVKSDTIEYDWIKNECLAQGSVKMMQGNVIAFSDLARFNKIENKIYLSGRIRFQKDETDYLSSENAVYDISNNIFTASGNVEGSFWIKEEKVQKEQNKSGDINFTTDSKVPDMVPAWSDSYK